MTHPSNLRGLLPVIALLIISGHVLAADERPDRVQADTTTRVAIYDHSDANEGSSGSKHLLQCLTVDQGFESHRVSPQDIRDGCLSDYDVLIMPGGSASLQSKKLEESGRRNIVTFVESGGGYVGICAGAYLATTQYSWSLKLVNARVWDRVHWARGTGDVVLTVTEPGCRLLLVDQPQVQVYYGQGPLLVPDTQPDLPGYEVLATYGTEIASKGAPEGTMTGTHAIVRTKYGQGRVICFSPHPEKPGGPHQLITSGVAWAAR